MIRREDCGPLWSDYYVLRRGPSVQHATAALLAINKVWQPTRVTRPVKSVFCKADAHLMYKRLYPEKLALHVTLPLQK